MKRKALLHLSLFVPLILALTHASHAQLIAGPGVTNTTSSRPASNRTFLFSGTIPGQLDGALTVTFSIYPDQQSATALWTETQVVQITAEKYSVMLGSTSATGLPSEIFSADQSHWLGVQVNGTEKRYLLVSVPYAMKAVNADQLGGLPFSEYVTAQQLQAALQGATTGTTPQPKATTAPTGQAAAAGTPPQPATDFTDNNTSEVLLVTQQGTGFAIHAITSGQAEAILAQNDSIGGTALHALATNAAGASIGVLAETASPQGIAGVFNSKAGGKILSLRNNGVEVAGVDVNGNLNTSGQVQAATFSGGGFGLFGIPQSAINATPFNNPFSVVARDSNGSFAANQITAATFSGGGFGLFGIPQSAINATPFNDPSSVVARDFSGSFAANQVTATTFVGGGFGLFGIPQSAINATPFNNPFSVVARDSNGSFAANQITATTFVGGGFGLFGIPQSAINATALNEPFSVVARDANGGFATGNVQVTGNLQVMNQLTSSGLVDFSGAVTAPVRTVLTANIPPLCFTSKELLLVTDAFPGQQLFVCNSSGNGWVLLGDGGGSAGSSNVSGNTTGTLENVNQLGSGTGLTVSSTSGTAVSASSTSGTALHGDSAAVGVQGSSQGGIGVWAAGTANDSTGTALLLSHASAGKLISGGVGSTTDPFETFSVTAQGDVTFNGGMMTPYEISGTWFSGSLAKLTSIPGNFGAGTVATTSPGDTSGAIGIISGLPASGSRIQVVQSGQMNCNFDGPATAGDYVGISKTVAGECTDIGATFPTDGQQVVGRVLSFTAPIGANRILLFESETHGGGGTGSGVIINTGAGLTGGPITSSGTISIANGGVTNAMLQNQFLFVNTATGLSGGGPVSLGGSLNLINTGVLSFNGRSGGVVAAAGDYSFAQIAGTAGASQLPSTTVYNNQSNTFTADQTIQGNLATTGNVNAGGSVTANAFTGTSANFTGAATSTNSVLAVNDTGASGSAISVNSANNPAALFISSGPTVFMAGKITGATTILSSNGDLTLNGTAHASAFSGDGSAITNVSAAKIGTLAPADIATNAALNTETTARQNADTAIQSSVASETGARQSADTTLQNNINAETTARASADASLQANINSVSTASAQLAAANTFAAKQTLAASTTTSASLNVPAGSAPSSPAAGDVWNTGSTLQYRDNASTTRSLVSTTQSGGLQLLKLTASISPASVGSQACTEQSFTVSGISTGDVLLSVLQPSTSSPGTNIAIGGFRVSAANTVAVQFCNVSRNNSTPTVGLYTFAFMR